MSDIINRKELSGLLGKYEMETAIEQMLRLSEASNIPFQEMLVCINHFLTDDFSLRYGFCLLLSNNWLRCMYPNYLYGANNHLVERMRLCQPCWKDLPYPPSYEFFADEVFTRGNSWRIPPCKKVKITLED